MACSSGGETSSRGASSFAAREAAAPPPTGASPPSRNGPLGEKLCTDPDWREFVRTKTVEGVAACRAAKELAHRLDVSTPLLHAIYDVLFLDEPPAETMRLFLRDFSYG